MYSTATTAAIRGLSCVPVKIEADVSDGMPSFEMVGYLSSEVKEAKERVRTALKNSGFKLPAKRITINFTPADIKKSGSSFDFPVAAAILAAFGYIDEEILKKYIILGEVGLNGDLRPVKGALPASLLAEKCGFEGVIVPPGNAREAAILPEIRVIPAGSLKDFTGLCDQGMPDNVFLSCPNDIWQTSYDVDFSEIRGQPLLRRACEIAVSGMHNILMIGPPGSGKTMAARRIPTIMPELDRQEKLELSQIYSLAGLLDEQRIVKNERPFRSPHHTATPQAMAGGGNIPRPGEISLSHHGVLFLDEIAEFKSSTLEVLREPMEDHEIHISRLGSSMVFPADFMLAAAMNPCPCGYYPDVNRCSCTPLSIKNYIGHISQALLNRIDICVETHDAGFAQIDPGTKEESSLEIRRRVTRVHEIQKERFAGSGCMYNSRMKNEDTEKYCALDSDSRRKLEEKYDEYGLSLRTYYKILKVARTIADMDECENIRWEHVREAFIFRNPDKKYWRLT